MIRSRIVTAVLLAGSVALAGTHASSQGEKPEPLVVHEWGTFTSVAGESGLAVPWIAPDSPSSDLPCFVQRNPLRYKVALSGTVRMETPVLYFYPSQPMTVNVHVDFRQGIMTEWFPHAKVTENSAMLFTRSFVGGIDWNQVKIEPRSPEAFPTENRPSPYYAARQTDAAPVRVGADQEKFLFYRGIAGFLPALSATLESNGEVVARNTDGNPIGDIILFQNHAGVVGYQQRQVNGDQVTFDPIVQDDESGPPLAELERLLIRHGLYTREAQAMVNTWRDSWFEEGTRLIYILPQPDVDAVLPLTIRPKPGDIRRVFVGRMEIITPTAVDDVKRALAGDNVSAFTTYGRFLEPIGRRIVSASDPAERGALERRVKLASAWWSENATAADRCK